MLEVYNYECHVFFPHMSVDVSNTTHLTDAQQKTWIDEIVLSTLRFSCSNNVLQHHSCSFTKADAKTLMKKKLHIHSSHSIIDIHYFILKASLKAF